MTLIAKAVKFHDWRLAEQTRSHSDLSNIEHHWAKTFGRSTACDSSDGGADNDGGGDDGYPARRFGLETRWVRRNRRGAVQAREFS